MRSEARRVKRGVEDGEDLEPPFSLVFVDGNHSYHAALTDLEASRSVSAAGAMVLMDDCDDPEVSHAWRVFIAHGGAVEHRRGLGWGGMCIGRFL